MAAELVTREAILKVALRQFADQGYAATSVQDIVDAAKVTKPTLYYYFKNKAALYQALVDRANEERQRVIEEGIKRGRSLEEKLVEIMAGLFEFLNKNRELVRLAFAAAFAAPKEFPAEVDCRTKSRCNFELIHSLMKEELARGAFDPAFDSRELAFGFYGSMNLYLMARLTMPDCKLDRKTAVRIVQLFLRGASKTK
ncbi:MAG: transcriptional regulator, TetR family [Verrucomicrobiales bacterium]|nr:transcriptional regulator, TetR family [Verrucomicrobiales bacterium]